MRVEAMSDRLERSEILFEFLATMRAASILPLLLMPVQWLLTRAAIDLTPHWMQAIVGLTGQGLNEWKLDWCGKSSDSPIAWFSKPILPSRPAGVCGFRQITCMSVILHFDAE